MKKLFAIIAALLVPTLVLAQSAPSLQLNFVPSPTQWMGYFSSKADVTNGTLNSPTINGNVGGSPTFTGSPVISVTPTGATTARTLADMTSQTQDVRNFFSGTSANCATDVSPAVNAAVTAGVTNIWLPKNCTYIPTGNNIPANLTIVGEDWQSSVIASSSPTTQDVNLGAHSMVKDVAVHGLFCYNAANPVNVDKLCPTPLAINVSDVTVTLHNWAYETSMRLGPTSTAPGAASASTDTPGLAITELSNGGDGIYGQTGGPTFPATGATAFRVVPIGSGDYGIYVLPSLTGDQTTQHYGIFIKDLSNNTNGRSLYVDRAGNGPDVTPSIRIDDSDATGSTYTSSPISVSLTHQTSGSLLSIAQSTTAFTGSFISLRAASGGLGSFNSGSFLSASVNTNTVFSVAVNGLVQAQAGVILGAKNNSSNRTGSNFAIEQTQFLSAADASVKAMFHLSVITSGSSAVRPTNDGTGTASASNCGNLTVNNQKATVHDITLTATDVTTPANGYTFYMPVGHLARFTGAGTTTWQGGTPVTFSDGTVTGIGVAITADTTNACPNIQFTPPTGNTDTWHIEASFEMDTVS